MPELALNQPNRMRKAYQLIREKRDSIEAEFTVAEVEMILERGTQKVHHHSIRITFSCKKVQQHYLRNFGLVLELGSLALANSSFMLTSSQEMMLGSSLR